VNTETGEIYTGEEQILAALALGLPIVPVSERVARLVKAGRRREIKASEKRKRKQARQDRKRNRAR
jgi:hypothetical protein